LERGISERRTSGQEVEVNTMEEGEINGVDGEEVVMEDMDYAKLIKQKKRVAGEVGHELLSDEELRAQFSAVKTVRSKEIYK
jgi:hypothetical protein